MTPLLVFSMIFEKTKEKMLISFVIFALCSITDFLDGYLARKWNVVSNFGKFIDPLADKVLTTSTFIMFVQFQIIPAWAVIIIVSREYMISILRAVAANSGKVIAASKWGKLKTVTQIFAILMIMLSLPFSLEMFWICTILTIFSGIDYLFLNRDVFK